MRVRTGWGGAPGPACAGAGRGPRGGVTRGSSSGSRGCTVVWLVRGGKARAAEAAEGAIRVDTARIDAERGVQFRLVTLVDVWGMGQQEGRCSGLGGRQLACPCQRCGDQDGATVRLP